MNTSAVVLSMTIFGALGTAALSAFSAVEQPSNDLILTQRSTQDSQSAGGYEIAEGGGNEDDAALLQRAAFPLLQGIQKAEASAGGQAFSAELDEEINRLVYAVMIGEQEILVDAANGEVIVTETKRDRRLALQPLTQVSLQQVIQTAEASVNLQAHSAELENESGNLVYKIAIANQEIYVDAGNGQILYQETEDDSKSAADAPGNVRSSIQVP